MLCSTCQVDLQGDLKLIEHALVDTWRALLKEKAQPRCLN
jgi:hypothetical protein